MNAETELIPRLSIGLPVYNGEKYLRDALDSLLGQTFTDYELIISDNCSTDGTEEICREYAARDARIRYVRSEENRGGAWNFRHVMALARAEYFKWAAHDDMCAPEYLERCIAVLDARPEIVLCFSRTTIINEHGAVVSHYIDDLNLDSPSAFQRYKRYHQRYRNGAACNVMFGVLRRRALMQTRQLGTYVSADVVLLGELALIGQFFEIPEYLFLRRDHPMVTIRAYASINEQIAWYNPRKKSMRFPVLRMFIEYLRSIWYLPISWSDKVQSYGLMTQWCVWRLKAHFGYLTHQTIS